MRLDLKIYPAFRMLLAMAVGLGAGYFQDFSLEWMSIVSFISVLLCLFFRNRFIAYYIVCIYLGIFLTGNIREITVNTPDKIYQEFTALIDAKIIKTLKLTDKFGKFIVEGSIDSKELPKLNSQRIILTVYGFQYRNIVLKPGNQIFADVWVHTPSKKILPNDFPEKNYAASLDVKWFAKTVSKNVSVISPPGKLDIIIGNSLNSIQNRILALFPKSSSAIVSALLIGDQTKIPYETKRLFSLSGTTHILSVSGLHVGIIALMIFFLIGFTKNPWIKFIIFTITLMIFVFLTGIQAAALRAGIMAVLFMLSKTLQRHSSALNIISLTILIILFVNPYMIYSAGFQMSISAISGIFIFFKPVSVFFESFIKSKNIITKFFISSLSISLSASIMVSPIVAYYFNVFSIVSPLANLLVVPTMTLAMCFAIIAFILSFIYYPIAVIYSAASDFLIRLSIEINKWAVSIPYSYMKDEDLVWLSLIISTGLIYLIFSKNHRQIVFRLVNIVFFILIFAFFQVKKPGQIQIYPRYQLVALDMPASKGIKRIALIDRAPYQKPIKDFAIENYLKDINDSLIIYYSGNAGLNISDNLKKVRSINSYEMNIEFQKFLHKKIKIKSSVPQIIDLKNEL